MNILVIDRFPAVFLEELQQLPVQVTYVPQAQRPEILSLLPEQDILIMNSKIKLDEEAADLAIRLKMVVRAGVGMDHINIPYLEQKGVRVLNTKGGNADAVGEQTVGMLLALRHNVLRADRQVRQFIWEREANRGWEIGGKTVGIIGYGFTGKAVAKRLSGFGCKVLAYDKYLEGYGDQYVTEASLEEIQAAAEILTLHIPLTDETRAWANKELFEGMQHPFFFLNLARGPIVHLEDLLAGLDSGKIRAAALDVLENEKMQTLTDRQKSLYQNLFGRDNVALSPHIGGWTVESLRNINGMILAFVQELLT